MKFLNLTPHPLTINENGGESITKYPISGPAPRLAVDRQALISFGRHNFVRSTMGAPEGLPPETDDTILIVSALVAEHPAVASRRDLAYPGEAIRDDNGRIVAARGLCAGPGLAARLRNLA